MKNMLLAYSKLFFVLFVWSTDFVLGKYLNFYLSPIISVAVRFFIASLGLLILLLLRYEFILPSKKDLAVLFVLGVFVVGLRYPLQYLALRYTDSVNSVLMTSMTPVVTALLAGTFLHEAVSKKQWGCIVLSVLGVCLIVFADFSQSFSFNPGDIMVLFGVILWSIYNLAGKKVMLHLSALQATFYTCSFSLLLTVPMAIVQSNRSEIVFAQIPWGVWLGILYIGLCGSCIGMFWWYDSIRLLGAVKVSLLYNIMPLFTAVLAFVFFRSRLHGRKQQAAY